MNNADGLSDNLSNQLKALGIDGMMGNGAGMMMNPYDPYAGMMAPMMGPIVGASRVCGFLPIIFLSFFSV